MILKSLLRKYERWNPVHPTCGTFWGTGVAVGCGVGWGPGYGPEVIGYVGAGYGAGFNVGITLLGVGIGLPANYRFTVPHSAFMATRSSKTDAARAKSIPANRISDGDGWDYIGSQILDVQGSPFASFPGFKKIEDLTGNIKNLPNTNKMLLSRARNIFGCPKGVSGSFLPWDRGMPK